MGPSNFHPELGVYGHSPHNLIEMHPQVTSPWGTPKMIVVSNQGYPAAIWMATRGGGSLTWRHVHHTMVVP